VLHGFVPWHGLPDDSNVQSAAQQSPPTLLPSSHCSPGSTVPSPQRLRTRSATAQSACCCALSVTLNVTTESPACASVGVQAKVLETGLGPVAGSAGVMTAPTGSPAAFNVRTSPASGSEPLTGNDTGVFASTTMGTFVLHCGGPSNSGGWFTCGTSWMKK